MKVSGHFHLREFVPLDVIEMMGSARAYHLMHPNMYQIAETVRVYLGKPLLINYGELTERGWRPMSSTTGSPASWHKTGRAIDICSHGYHASELFEIIQRDWSGFRFMGVRRAEDPHITKTWLHLDMQETKSHYLKVFRP